MLVASVLPISTPQHRRLGRRHHMGGPRTDLPDTTGTTLADHQPIGCRIVAGATRKLGPGADYRVTAAGQAEVLLEHYA